MKTPAGAVIATTAICNENLNRPPERLISSRRYGKNWDRVFPAVIANGMFTISLIKVLKIPADLCGTQIASCQHMIPS